MTTAHPSMSETVDSRIAAQLYVFGAPAQDLQSGLDEVLKQAAAAGFQNVQGWLDYYKDETSAQRVSSLLAAHHLGMPCAYAGGGMHTPGEAQKTISRILEQAPIAARHGLKVVINNPDPIQREKTDAELACQADALNQLGKALRENGLKLAVHQHDPEMKSEAREWRHILNHTRPEDVFFCLDTHWIFRGGQDPCQLLMEAGSRIVDLHLRNSKNGAWAEDFSDGDIDYSKVASLLKQIDYKGYYTVELAYEKETVQTRSLQANLATSLAYLKKTFFTP